MAVIVANLYQQAAMCTTDKHRAPRWLINLALKYLPAVLRMQEKVETVLSQKVSARVFERENHGLARVMLL